jgi:hypothetical protein
MNLRTLLKVLSFLIGGCIALLGTGWVFITASGAIKTSPIAGYVAGSGFLLIATPLLMLPFSTRIAKSLLVLVMLVLALGMLWLAFQPDLPTNHPTLVQVAAITFAITLLARVGLTLRRKRSPLGT